MSVKVMETLNNERISARFQQEETQTRMEKANTAYMLVVNAFNAGVHNTASLLLCKHNETSHKYRGLLLGRLWDEGATVEELLTGRLQHDVGFSEVAYKLDRNLAITKKPFPALSNKEIIKELCKTVAVLLKKYSGKEEHKFTTGGQKINQAVVSALFKVGKQKNIPVSHLGIDYDTRVKMIDQCLKWTTGNKKVTIDMAISAHQKFVGDSKGLYSRVIDLKEATQGYGEHIQTLMKEGYLDVTMGLTTKEEMDQAKLSSNELPSVTIHQVRTKEASPEIDFSVFVVHNFVSPVFMQKWMKRLNELVFTDGKKGKSNAFIRNCSTTRLPAPILIGKGLVYGGLIPDEMEQELLKMAVLLAEEQRTIIERVYGRYKVTWHCNLVHTVLAAIHDAIYSAHSDANPTCCSDQESSQPYIHVTDDLYLPRPKEMQVVTMVFSNCKDEFSTELVYTEGNNPTALVRIPLSSCCLHWQGPGSQTLGIKHQTKMIKNLCTRGVFRAHSTFRFTLDPKVNNIAFNERLMKAMETTDPYDSSNWEKQYNRTGVVDICTNCAAVPLPLEPSMSFLENNFSRSSKQEKNPTAVEANTCSVNLNSNSLSDCYDQVPHELYLKIVPAGRCATIRLAGTLAQELSSAYSVKELFDAGYLLEVQTEKNQKAIPCIHQVQVGTVMNCLGDSVPKMVIPTPGSHYRLSNICAEAGLIHKNRSHRIYSPKKGTQRIIVISQSYKNDFHGIQNYLNRLDQRKINCKKQPFYNDDFDGTIWIHGSGGSPAIQGDVEPDANICSKVDPMIVIPRSQLLSNPLNIALTEMVLAGEVVTVYVNEAMFDSVTVQDASKMKSNPTMCRCLGVFSAEEAVWKRDTEEVVLMNHCKDPQQKQKFARYKLGPYLRIALKPLFSNTDLESMWGQEESEPTQSRKRKRNILIPFGCREYIEANIALGGVNDAASLMPGKMILRSTMIKQFVQSNKIKRYISDGEKTSSNTEQDTSDSDGDADDEDRSVDSMQTHGTEDETETGISASVYGLVNAIAMCSVAGAYRYNKECLQVVNGKSCAMPLLKECDLPDVFRIHPMPMPNRALDVTSIGLRDDLFIDGTFDRCRTGKGDRIKYKQGYRDDLINTMFKSIMLQFTGRLNSFLQYSCFTTQGQSIIPTIRDIKPFLAFVQTTLTSKGISKGIPRWISDQHKGSIPKGTKVYTGFAQFVTNVGKQLPDVVEEMIDSADKKSRTRYRALIKLRDMLDRCCQTDDTSKLNFMAHQILADVEEVFREPFGTVLPDSVVAGRGAQQGLKMLKNGKCQGPEINIQQALKLIIDYMQEQATKEDLVMTGYQRIGVKSEVCNKVNGRPFNATDAEHFLCKMWVITKYTLPAYTNARQPKLTKPHCHPVNLRGRESKPCPLLEEIMTDILQGYKKGRQDLEAPAFCLLHGEASRVKRYKSKPE